MLSFLTTESKEWHLSTLVPTHCFTTPRLQIRESPLTKPLSVISHSEASTPKEQKEELILPWSQFVSRHLSGYPSRQKAMQLIFQLFENDQIYELCSPQNRLLSPMAPHNLNQPILSVPLDVSFLGTALQHYIAHYRPSHTVIEKVLQRVKQQLSFIDQELSML